MFQLSVVLLASGGSQASSNMFSILFLPSLPIYGHVPPTHGGSGPVQEVLWFHHHVCPRWVPLFFCHMLRLVTTRHDSRGSCLMWNTLWCVLVSSDGLNPQLCLQEGTKRLLRFWPQGSETASVFSVKPRRVRMRMTSPPPSPSARLPVTGDACALHK